MHTYTKVWYMYCSKIMTFEIKMFCNMHAVYTLALLRKQTSLKLMNFAGMPCLYKIRNQEGMMLNRKFHTLENSTNYLQHIQKLYHIHHIFHTNISQ